MRLNKSIEEKKRRMEMAKKKETAKNVAVGTAIGTALGAVTGWLFAPKSGKETRQDISDKSKEVADNVKHTVHDSVEVTKEWTDKIMQDVKENVEVLKVKKSQLKDGLKEESSEVLEDLGEGIANIGEIVEEQAEELKKEIE